ncbi:MAG TPA: SUMF1/EgtB/PvdO family nonheme iron enzyme, partial [Spirochaetota bacterium]|nr:SUMF1/EgtB/PvdO family nonheme iron enzyme [Spirochaetota bacterium]
LASDYIAQGLNGGNAALTTGFYWTPTLYASGATKDYNDAVATQAVAWYVANAGGTFHQVATLAPNRLGLYDMNGNLSEWTFTIGTDPNSRWLAGGNYTEVQTVMRSSMIAYWGANACDVPVGFRVAKTR